MKMLGWSCNVLFLSIFIFGAVVAKYKINIASLKKCDFIDDSMMDTGVDFVYHFGVHKVNRKTTLISANYTIKNKKMGPMSFTFRYYELAQSGAKNLAQILNKMNCHNPVARTYLKILKVNTDKGCYVAPGTYVVNDINLNDFAWFFAHSIFKLGRYGFDVEMSTDQGIVACISLLIDIIKNIK